MEAITLFLPVIWAIVATALGIILYRTSAALFEDQRRSRTQTRTLRLTGSVVIAGIAFLGIRGATPADRLAMPRAALRAELDEIDRSILEAQAALTNEDPSGCKIALLRLSQTAARLRQTLNVQPEQRKPEAARP
jgi:hypothetical protein